MKASIYRRSYQNGIKSPFAGPMERDFGTGGEPPSPARFPHVGGIASGGPRKGAVGPIARGVHAGAPGSPTHANLPASSELLAEIRFLEYRLEVVEAWPASKRRSAVVDAIFSRLLSLGWVAPVNRGTENGFPAGFASLP
jgi:hypothetical protein